MNSECRERLGSMPDGRLREWVECWKETIDEASCRSIVGALVLGSTLPKMSDDAVGSKRVRQSECVPLSLVRCFDRGVHLRQASPAGVCGKRCECALTMSARARALLERLIGVCRGCSRSRGGVKDCLLHRVHGIRENRSIPSEMVQICGTLAWPLGQDGSVGVALAGRRSRHCVEVFRCGQIGASSVFPSRK